MLSNYIDAVAAIKEAVLQGQYKAVKEVNRVQLAVYFAIGKYLSANTVREFGALVPSSPSATNYAVNFRG